MKKITKEDIRVWAEGTICPEQIWLYIGNRFNDSNKIGFIHLRSGVLTLTPVEDGKFDLSEHLYVKRFWFKPYKGMFDNADERKKYVTKCMRKIVRWYNRKYKCVSEPL